MGIAQRTIALTDGAEALTLETGAERLTLRGHARPALLTKLQRISGVEQDYGSVDLSDPEQVAFLNRLLADVRLAEGEAPGGSLLGYEPKERAPFGGVRRTSLGVGEVVAFRLTSGASFATVPGTDQPDRRTDADVDVVEWKAPLTAGPVTVLIGDEETRIDFDVVAPDGRTSGIPLGEPLREEHYVHLFAILHHPLSVSFANVEMNEGEGDGVGTGMYADRTLVHTRNEEWTRLSSLRDAPFGNASFDGAGIPIDSINDLYGEGTITWTIPISYRVGAQALEGTTVTQTMKWDGGQATWSKAGATVSAEFELE